MASSASFDSSREPDTRLSEVNIDAGKPRASRQLKSRKVAVIGAGAAGLAAAKELIREGHAVTVFEQNSRVGGLWVYDPDREEEDLLGANPTRKRVHSSVYASLRTNLMREIMSYADFPFLPTGLEGRDDRRFPGHAEVAAYLHDFALCFGLLDVVQFCTLVEHVGFCKRGVESGGESGVEMVWTVRTRRTDVSDGGVNEAEFDAVVVCNGHYAEPRLADSPDLSKWPGVHMHSHNYRERNSFANQIVVIIGNGSSAGDISRDIAQVAKEVHISGRTWDMWSCWNRSEFVDFSKPRGPYGNIWLHSPIECVGEDGTLKFKNGESISADIIMQCTGFLYSFPFLHTQGEVGIDENHVGPLYEHVFPPSLAPSLAFIGIPYKVASIFRMFELQSRWVAMVLSSKIDLPSRQEMMNSVKKFYAELQTSGRSKLWAHCLSSTQENYDKWLSDQTGSDPGEPWRWEMATTYIQSRVENPGIRKEEWVPNELLLKEAYRCLQKTLLEARCS